jgi:hypothetical protein
LSSSDLSAVLPQSAAPTLSLLLTTRDGPRHAHRVADRWVYTDIRLEPLQSFAATPPQGLPSPRRPSRELSGREEPFYDGPGWIGGRLANVVCARLGSSYVVRVEGLPALLVGHGGCAVSAGGRVAAPADADALLEAVLGPGLILALALDGTFTLHAGAVAARDGAVLFLGESGAGKSTVARALAGLPGFEPIADDVLPGEVGVAGLTGLPHFPQLKLPESEQYGAARPARVRVRAILLLAGDEGAGDDVRIDRPAASDAVLALASSIVAARLFDAPLRVRSLDFCVAAVAAVPVHRLTFPKRLESLSAIADAVAAHLATLAD